MDNEIEALRAAQELITITPFAKWLDAQASDDGDELVIRVPFNELLIGNSRIRAIHGGIMASILELTAAATLAAYDFEASRRKPISMQINYLKSTKDVETNAKGIVRKIGRRIDTIEAIAWQANPEKPVAIGICDFRRTRLKDKPQ